MFSGYSLFKNTSRINEIQSSPVSGGVVMLCGGVCCLPGGLYTSLSRFSLSGVGVLLKTLWDQLWQIACSKSVWALVAWTVKWGSSRIHSVVGAEDLLLLKQRYTDRCC